MKKGKSFKQKATPFELEKTSKKAEVAEPPKENNDDFEHIVEKGKKIKERIRKLCEDKFTPQQRQRESEFEQSIIQAASFIGKHVDLYDSEELNPVASFELDPKDSYNSKKPQVKLFPVSEHKLFPPRRPQTGWEVGLRKFEEVEEKKKKRADMEAAKYAATFTTQDLKEKEENQPTVSKKHSILNISLTELKKAQYATRNLPELTTEVIDRYFDDESVKKFNNTYKQLKQQGSIVHGGYNALHEVVKDPDPENVLTVAKRKLDEQAVFTPREDNLLANNDRRKMMAGKEKVRPKSSSAASSYAMHKRSISTSALLTNNSATKEMASSAIPSFSKTNLSPIQSAPNLKNLGKQNQKNSSHVQIVEEIDLSTSPSIQQSGKSRSVGWINSVDLENDDDEEIDIFKVTDPPVSPPASQLPPSAKSVPNLSLEKESSKADPSKFMSSRSSSASSVHTLQTFNSSQDRKKLHFELPSSKNGGMQESSLDQGESSTSSKLDDRSYIDKGADLEYAPGSPRAIFLSGCLKQGLPPRAHVLLRKRISSSINLAHIGIGNEMAKVLAEALPSLPYLQAINLCDNNLEDDGLSAIIQAIAAHPTIEIVDISQNIIGSDAANALADFVGNPDCLLQCLRMSDANIDDGECASFVEVLMNNRHLKELDMSKNLLGKDENLNTVQPDFTTGGEALSELLKEGLCPIQTLNLHWNMIRLEGAEVLCNSIRSNTHLMNLDLSYNALGSSAACILGASLMENKTLRVLNIANNGIDTIGCFTLFVGLRQNKSLREINIDGNPIGEQGARILMKTVAYEGHRLKISSNNCDFNIKSSNCKFELQSPFGEYFFDLTQPYDRAILMELLDIAANDPNVQINSLEHSETVVSKNLIRPSSAAPSAQNNSRPQSAKGTNSGPNSRPQSANPAGKGSTAAAAVAAAYDKPKIGGTIYRIMRFDEHCDDLSEEERKELEFLSSFQKAIEMSANEFFEIAKRFDTEGKGSVSALSIKKFLQELNLQQVNRVMNEIKFTIDPSGSGYYGVEEFVEYFVERCKVVKARIKHMTSKPHCAVYRPASTKASATLSALSFAPMTPYVPPTTGSVYVKVIESYDVSADDNEMTSPLTDSQCKQLIKTAKESSNPLQLMLFGIESFQLHLEEAQLLIKEIGSRSDDPILALSKILLRMKSYYSAMRLMHCYTHNDIVKIRRLKQRLGNAYYPLVGLYSGYYVLDLSNENDRLCLKKLIEKSVKNVDSRRKSGLWDTSQQGHWSCFRNEYHYWNYGSGEERESITISPKYFFPVPHRGKLEFDFVNIQRPDVSVNRPADHDRIIDCLLMSGLLEEEYIKDIVCKINDLNMASRRNILSDGNPYWRTSIGRSLAIGEHIHTMYSTLSQRHESKRKAMKRELIKNLAPDKPKDKRKGGDAKTRSFYSSTASVKKVNRDHQNDVQHASTGHVTTNSTASGEQSKESSIPEAKPLPKDSKILLRIKKIANAFRSLVFKSRAESSGKSWGKRLHEVMEANSSDEYKCAALLEYFETELTSLWLYCVHVSVILELFSPVGLANRSSMGSYRVELVVMLFDRILDLHNFELVLMVLNAEEQAAIYARIGILNVFNPCKPEGGYSFDLHRWEERQVTKILIHLSVVEPGENWLNKEFCFDRGFLPMPGWDLNITWLNEEGLPKKGLLSFEMFAGDGMRQLGCCVDPRLRLMLTSLVLVNQRDFATEIRRGDLLSEEKMFNYERGNKNPVNFFPNMTTKAQHSAPSNPAGYGINAVASKKGTKRAPTRTIMPTERDEVPGSAAGSDSEYEKGDATGTHTPAEFINNNPNYKPLLPLLKLLSQMDILALLNAPASTEYNPTSISTFYAFSYEDCNRHLTDETDVTWNYTSGTQKYESWVMK